MTLTDQQKESFWENGYLPYHRILSDAELDVVRQRSEDIISGKVNHVPPRYIQFEARFRAGLPDDVEPLDAVRKMTQLCYFDDEFERIARKPEIVDVIEDLLGPNIKLYTDQLMMKPRFNGTVTDWHQDSMAWRHFAPQGHISCWVALDDATVSLSALKSSLSPSSCRPEAACSITASTFTAPAPMRRPTAAAAWPSTTFAPRRCTSASKTKRAVCSPNARSRTASFASC